MVVSHLITYTPWLFYRLRVRILDTTRPSDVEIFPPPYAVFCYIL